MQSDHGETSSTGRLNKTLVVISSSQCRRTPKTWFQCGGTMSLNHPGFISNQYFQMECISGSDLLKAWPRIRTRRNLTLKVI